MKKKIKSGADVLATKMWREWITRNADRTTTSNPRIPLHFMVGQGGLF